MRIAITVTPAYPPDHPGIKVIAGVIVYSKILLGGRVIRAGKKVGDVKKAKGVEVIGEVKEVALYINKFGNRCSVLYANRGYSSLL